MARCGPNVAHSRSGEASSQKQESCLHCCAAQADLYNEVHPNKAFPDGAPYWTYDAGANETYNFRSAVLRYFLLYYVHYCMQFCTVYGSVYGTVYCAFPNGPACVTRGLGCTLRRGDEGDS